MKSFTCRPRWTLVRDAYPSISPNSAGFVNCQADVPGRAFSSSIRVAAPDHVGNKRQTSRTVCARRQLRQLHERSRITMGKAIIDLVITLCLNYRVDVWIQNCAIACDAQSQKGDDSSVV